MAEARSCSLPPLYSEQLLTTRYLELLLWRWSGQCVKLTTHLHQVMRLRMCGSLPQCPLYNCTAYASAQWQHEEGASMVFQKLVTYHITMWQKNIADCNLNLHLQENLKFHIRVHYLWWTNLPVIAMEGSNT